MSSSPAPPDLADELIHKARAGTPANASGARRAALYLRQPPTRNGEEGIDRQRERTTALAQTPRLAYDVSGTEARPTSQRIIHGRQMTSEMRPSASPVIAIPRPP